VPQAYFALGLVGYPLGHSLSPLLHTAALKACGLQGEYRLYPVTPSGGELETLRSLLDEVRRGRLQGLNVTIPHKQAVLPFLDHLSPTAQGVGAVNTIFYRDGRLVGENTDVAGFWADLAKNFPSPTGSGVSGEGPAGGGRGDHGDQLPPEALVLGAGGSARAVVYSLSQAGWSVVVAARRLEQVRELVKTFSVLKYPVSERELSQASLADLISGHEIRLIVNTTPLGMRTYLDASPWPAGLAFPERAFVYDLVYNPPQTVFMHQARLAGLGATNGLGMLLEQAVLSFELWTGVRPSIDILRKALNG
jgi:shikimate dehydrogenase